MAGGGSVLGDGAALASCTAHLNWWAGPLSADSTCPENLHFHWKCAVHLALAANPRPQREL